MHIRRPFFSGCFEEREGILMSGTKGPGKVRADRTGILGCNTFSAVLCVKWMRMNSLYFLFVLLDYGVRVLTPSERVGSGVWVDRVE
jgi:hypothetical protein